MIPRKEFYFVRHGQTDHNAAALTSSQSDISLNDKGKEQAHSIKAIISALPIQTVSFSPLKRAVETKNILMANAPRHECEIDNLSECSQKVWEEMTKLELTAYKEGSESVKNFMNQVLQGINRALSQTDPVLIVAHGGVHWAICCLLGIQNHPWIIDNCIPTHFSIGVDAKWQARKLN